MNSFLRLLIQDSHTEHNENKSLEAKHGLQILLRVTLLHLFQEGHTSTINTLVELGADPHARDKKGRTGRMTFSVPLCKVIFSDHAA